jgi:CBS domain-containing protein
MMLKNNITLPIGCRVLQAIQKVYEIMVRKVITAKPTTNLTEIARLMRKNRVGSVIVVRSGRPVGILTESDFIRLVARGTDMKSGVAEDFMNRDVITCDSSITVVDALMVMRAEKIRHLPTVKNGRLVGVISIRDLIAATQFSSFYVI